MEVAQLYGVECCDDEQNDVGTVGTGLVELVFVHHEVLAQDRDVHGGAHRVEVGEAAVETAGLREHTDGPGSACGIQAGEGAWVGNLSEVTARR